MQIDLTQEEIRALVSAVQYMDKYYPDDDADNAIVKMELAAGTVHSSDNACTLDRQDICRVCRKNHNVMPCWQCGHRVYRDPESCEGCAGKPDPNPSRVKFQTEELQRRTLQIQRLPPAAEESEHLGLSAILAKVST